MKNEKDVFTIAKERGEEYIREQKKNSILQIITDSDIAAAEMRLQEAAKANDEEAFIKAKAEIESLKNRAEMAKMREKMGVKPVLPTDLIKEVLGPVYREMEKENKRILNELADVLEKAMKLASDGCENINRYNVIINYWKAYVLRTSENLPYDMIRDTGFFRGLNFAFRIQQMRELGRG